MPAEVSAFAETVSRSMRCEFNCTDQIAQKMSRWRLKVKQLAMNDDNRLLCLLATSLEFFVASTNPFVKQFSIDCRFPHRSSTKLYHAQRRPDGRSQWFKSNAACIILISVQRNQASRAARCA